MKRLFTMTTVLILTLVASRRVDAEDLYSVIDLGDLPFPGDFPPVAKAINAGFLANRRP